MQVLHPWYSSLQSNANHTNKLQLLILLYKFKSSQSGKKNYQLF